VKGISKHVNTKQLLMHHRVLRQHNRASSLPAAQALHNHKSRVKRSMHSWLACYDKCTGQAQGVVAHSPC
jgi:hypothetical protein